MKKRNPWLVMGLAMGLPSTLVGVFFLLTQLVQKDIISWTHTLVIMVAVVISTLILMVKYGMGSKD